MKTTTMLAAVAAAVCVAPTLAVADDLLVIPGIGPEAGYGRPSYREATFPPPQHNALGMPIAAPVPSDRPSYRQEYNNFPPAGGRYGGGFLEYVMTGGRTEPVAEPVPSSYAAPAYAAPAYAAPAYAAPVEATPLGGLFGLSTPAPSAYTATAINPRRVSLPKGGLPDYAPDGAQAGLAPAPDAASSYAAYAPAAAQPAAGEPFYAQPTMPFAAPGAYQPSASEPDAVAAAGERQIDPVYERQMVAYSGHERPGTVVIDTPDKFLYLVQGNGRAIRYGIGVGRPGFTWAGVKSISRKAEWPGWTPPSQMLKRRPDLPRHMVGGEGNPLGARAMYLGSSMYRIHGTNEPQTIGTNVSSGCIRMMNRDVIDLYGRVGVGTRVVVL